MSGDWTPKPCEAWQASWDGQVLTSGNNTKHIADALNASRVVSQLRLEANYVRPGTLTFDYLIEDPADLYDNGLQFFIHAGAKSSTRAKVFARSNARKWQTYHVNVTETGRYTFTWQYSTETKEDLEDHLFTRAQLRTVALEGTAFADTVCLPCTHGPALADQDAMCRFCQANEVRFMRYLTH